MAVYKNAKTKNVPGIFSVHMYTAVYTTVYTCIHICTYTYDIHMYIHMYIKKNDFIHYQLAGAC